MKVKQYMHRRNDVKGLVDRLRNVNVADLKWGSICNEAATAIEQLAAENASMRAVTERQMADRQREIDALKKTCEEYAVWLDEKEERLEALETANEEVEKLCIEQAELLKPKKYGMDEWKGGEEARASYIERITALEKLSAEQDRKMREQELRHQAELERLRTALGMFLFHPTAFNESVENARRVLAVRDE